MYPGAPAIFWRETRQREIEPESIVLDMQHETHLCSMWRWNCSRFCSSAVSSGNNETTFESFSTAQRPKEHTSSGREGWKRVCAITDTESAPDVDSPKE